MKKMLIGVALLFAAGFFAVVASTASLTGLVAWAGFMSVCLFVGGVILTATQSFILVDEYDKAKEYDRKEKTLAQRTRELELRKAERLELFEVRP